MVVRAFLCQNVATGFLFGTFGTTLLAVQARFGSSRATSSLGLSLALLTLGLLGPLTAKLIDRLTLRWTMALGLALSGAGYFTLAIAPSSIVFLLAYALLVGPGFALFGPLPSTFLASNWFVARQGMVVGIVCVPLFTALAPPVTIAMLGRFGLTIFYLSLAGAHLLLLPLVLTIIERPSLIGQQALGAELAVSTADPLGQTTAPAPVSLLRSKAFWVIVVGGGMLTGSSIVAISHIVALATERGLSGVQASLLVSVIGITSMAGAMAIGVLCDWIGPSRALALAAAGACVAWTCIFVTTWLPILVIAVALHGLSFGGVFPAVGVLSRHLFGGAAMARAVGLFMLLTIPFTFCFSPMGGWIRDVTGSYDLVIVMVAVSSGLVSAAFMALWRAERKGMHRRTMPGACLTG